MKIDGLYEGRAVQRASGAVAAGAASGFAAALDRARAGTRVSPAAASPEVSTEKPMTRAERIRAANEAAYAEFREYMDKSPAERMRDVILREMGLTEEQLEALPPEQREAVEKEIAARISERLLLQAERELEAASRRIELAVRGVTVPPGEEVPLPPL